MKPTPSLEQERQALLDQIHSSRAAYRRMLGQYDQPAQPSGSAAYGNDTRLPGQQGRQVPQVRGMPAEFPRSRTVRWVVEHPWAAAGATAGLVALIVLGPRGIKKGVASVKKRSRKEAPEAYFSRARHDAPTAREVMAQRPSAGGAAVAGMMGLATMMLRDPQRMQMAAKNATRAWQWFQSWRQNQMQSRARKARGLVDWNRPPAAGS